VLLSVANGNLTTPAALVVLIVGTAMLGMGNGAVFQLVPQRFGRDVGLMTGLVGMTGGVGGFYLAASLGYAQQFTGSYAFGFIAFAMLSLAALGGIVTVRPRWRREIAQMGGLAPARV
jgi:NNP family nitrate/nitrite transporter-like MFS transporter